MVAKKIVVTESEEKEVVAAPADASSTAQEPFALPSRKASTPSEHPSHRWPVNNQASTPRASSRRTSVVRGAVKWIRPRRRVVISLVIAVIAAIAAWQLLINRTQSDPLPKSLLKEVTFPVYYPHSTVKSYKYVPGSGNYAGGKLTYNLGASGPIIHISEQALNVKAPDAHQLQNLGFAVFQTPSGQAAVGTSGNVLNGLLIAHKTLIIVNGLGGVSRQDFTQVINSLGS